METRGKQGQVVITIDVETGNLVSVTDEAGESFERFTPTPENPLVLQEVFKATSGGTILYARTNPCYKWVLWDGILYRRQVSCP